MQAHLKVVGGKNDGREIKISVPEFYIGRGEEAHLRPSSDLISRMHCVIGLVEGRVEVEDLKSRNGTFVNNAQLQGVHKAKSGDRLKVGRLTFEILIDQSKAGNKKPVVKDVAEAAARTVKKPKQVENFEDSITDWLSDNDEAPLDSSFGSGNLQFSLDDIEITSSKDKSIEELKADSVAGDSTESNDSVSDDESSESGKKKKKKKEVGKLPPLPKFSHDDSTSAAGDVLKKFFNRR